jgi:4-hydroxybenzoyl-CoA thioesterase
MFKRDKLIRFHHCDPAGIVFYPQYFVLFNELVEDWFQDGLRIDFGKFHAVQKLGLTMCKIECEFPAPSKLGEKLTLRLTMKEIGNTSLTLAISGSTAGEERVRATLVVVLASLATRRAIPIPPDLRARFERFQAP